MFATYLSDFLEVWKLQIGQLGSELTLLPECRCEPEESFSTLRGRAGGKTENNAGLSFAFN
jgi:hypothetical protein